MRSPFRQFGASAREDGLRASESAYLKNRTGIALLDREKPNPEDSEGRQYGS
jgi:hypothetical protein